jgi:hypothetical protein
MRRAAPKRGATSGAEPTIEQMRLTVMTHFATGLFQVIGLTDDELRVLHEELFESGGILDIVAARAPVLIAKVERKRRRKGLRVIKGGEHA